MSQVSEALNKIGPGSCHYVVADLSVSTLSGSVIHLSHCYKQSKAGCDALADNIKQKESKIHILVNNSGATWGAPFDK